MKVSFSSAAGSAQGARGAPRPAGGGFSLGSTGGTRETSASAKVAGPASVTSLDAILAMQALGDPLERRRRTVRRAGQILDVLDEVKVALLEGSLSPLALDRLMSAVREQREDTEDRALEGVLNEIETRAAVELAKLGMAA